jgi:hypothetical protein
VQQLSVSLFHPRAGDFRLATASRCKQKTSFISWDKLNKLKLLKDVKNTKIKLTISITTETEEKARTDGTWFHVIADNLLRHEIALGSDWDADNPSEDEDDDELVDECDHQSTESGDNPEGEDSDGFVQVPQPIGKSMVQCDLIKR